MKAFTPKKRIKNTFHAEKATSHARDMPFLFFLFIMIEKGMEQNQQGKVMGYEIVSQKKEKPKPAF